MILLNTEIPSGIRTQAHCGLAQAILGTDDGKFPSAADDSDGQDGRQRPV